MAGFIQFQQSSFSAGSRFLLLPGILLFSFGFLILVMPQLLAFLVASFFMMTGISFILMSLRSKRPKNTGTITIEPQSRFFE